MTTVLGPLPPGDVGYYGVDWSDQLDAVAGDSLTGNLIIDCASPDLTISNLKLAGTTVTFNASSPTAAVYRLTARAGFAPSGRMLSQQFELVIGVPPASEPVSLDEARRYLRLDTSGNPPAHPDDELVQSVITAARQYCEGETGLTMVTTQLTDYRESWDDRERSSVHRFMEYHASAWDFLPYHYQTFARPSFVLLHAPVISVDEIRYLDTDGVLQVLTPDQYRTIPFAGPLIRIEPAVGDTWPTLYPGVHGAVQIDYTAGYNGPIDEGLRTAIKLMIGIYYENRGIYADEKLVPQGVSDMLDGYRVL
jgi:uncharacterized phiE125 gp8 family phage protein